MGLLSCLESVYLGDLERVALRRRVKHELLCLSLAVVWCGEVRPVTIIFLNSTLLPRRDSPELVIIFSVSYVM